MLHKLYINTERLKRDLKRILYESLDKNKNKCIKFNTLNRQLKGGENQCLNTDTKRVPDHQRKNFVRVIKPNR